MSLEVHTRRFEIGTIGELPDGAKIISVFPSQFSQYTASGIVVVFTLEKNVGF